MAVVPVTSEVLPLLVLVLANHKLSSRTCRNGNFTGQFRFYVLYALLLLLLLRQVHRHLFLLLILILRHFPIHLPLLPIVVY